MNTIIEDTIVDRNGNSSPVTITLPNPKLKAAKAAVEALAIKLAWMPPTPRNKRLHAALKTFSLTTEERQTLSTVFVEAVYDYQIAHPANHTAQEKAVKTLALESVTDGYSDQQAREALEALLNSFQVSPGARYDHRMLFRSQRRLAIANANR